MPRPAADEADSTRLRLTFLAMMIVSLFVLLLARLWFLQVMAGPRYVEAAETNAVRTIPVEAPRGRILDVDGDVLVDNEFVTMVSVNPQEMGGEERQDEVLADLADLLGTDLETVRERIDSSRVSAVSPKPIATDVPDDIAAYIFENNATLYPGVYVSNEPLRSYPNGALAAHVLGYAGEISDAELADDAYAGYRPGDLIGWAGLERSYESTLHGTEGSVELDVNRSNEVVGEPRETLPVPGDDLRTTIEADAQELAETALQEGIEVARTLRNNGEPLPAPAGAVVVLDPRDGAIRALASYPTYDPQEFVGGVGQDYWSWLQDPSNDFPLINRAIAGAYPPGSVFKVVTASAALTDGYMDQESTLNCPGQFEFGPQVFRNWHPGGEGQMDLARSLVRSCDTVYYQLAQQMWFDEQQQYARNGQEHIPNMARGYGLGSPLGIDLPGEKGGVVPGRQWRYDYWQGARDTYCAKAQTLAAGSYAQQINADLCADGARWRGGDAVNLSIGQGDMQTTPLQMAAVFAAVANRGTIPRPHLGAATIARDGAETPIETEPVGTVPVTPENLAYLETGLVGVTSGPGGTAAGTFGDFPFPIAGKTGTAELKPKQPYAWFAGYNTSPVDGQQYVVVALVEEGGGGSQTAAPIVRRIFEGLLGTEETAIEAGAASD